MRVILKDQIKYYSNNFKKTTDVQASLEVTVRYIISIFVLFNLFLPITASAEDAIKNAIKNPNFL